MYLRIMWAFSMMENVIRRQNINNLSCFFCAMYVYDNKQCNHVSHAFVQETVTLSEECTNGQEIRDSYELSYTTNSGTPITTCVVNGTECSNGTCHHELQSNTVDSRCLPPVSQFSDEGMTVSVTASNVLGRSNPGMSRNISEFSEFELQLKNIVWENMCQPCSDFLVLK